MFSKCHAHVCLRNFILRVMSLLAAPIVQMTHVLARINFIFLEKRPGPNLKVFQNRIWTSAKRLEKKFSSKTKFTTFLQISSSNFRLKKC